MFAMAQFFFRQQAERHNDQAATNIGGKRRVKAEEKPVCYGYEENAQSTRCQHKNTISSSEEYPHRNDGGKDRTRPRDKSEKGCHRDWELCQRMNNDLKALGDLLEPAETDSMT